MRVANVLRRVDAPANDHERTVERPNSRAIGSTAPLRGDQASASIDVR